MYFTVSLLTVQDMSGEKYQVYEPAQSADPATSLSPDRAVYHVVELAQSADQDGSQSPGLGSVRERGAPPTYLETNLDIENSTEERELVALQPGSQRGEGTSRPSAR